jgi:hypothetical protein
MELQPSFPENNIVPSQSKNLMRLLRNCLLSKSSKSSTYCGQPPNSRLGQLCGTGGPLNSLFSAWQHRDINNSISPIPESEFPGPTDFLRPGERLATFEDDDHPIGRLFESNRSKASVWTWTMRVGSGRYPQCWIEQGGDIDLKYLLMASMNQVAHYGRRNLRK